MIGAVRQVTRLEDFDAIADAAKGWDLDFRLLAGGKATGEIEAVATGRAVVQRNRFGWKLLQRGTSPRGYRTFGVGVDADQSFPWCGQSVRDDWLLSFPVDGEFESISDESFHSYSLTFDEELVRETAQLLYGPPGRESLPAAGAFNVGHERLGLIRGILRRIATTSRMQPSPGQARGLSRDIEWDLLSEILQAFAAGREEWKPTGRLRAIALKRATAFIEDSGGQSLTVRELCEVSGASWRTLDYAFKERYGVSPKTYLQTRQLNSVRRDLRASGPGEDTVRDVAARWGFWHMSQFASDYRKLFGELPSQTLGSRRASPEGCA